MLSKSSLNDHNLVLILGAAEMVKLKKGVVTALDIAHELGQKSAVGVLYTVIQHDAWVETGLDRKVECELSH